MQQYLELIVDILDNGPLRSERTGTGTFSVFGRQIRFGLTEGFPLVTTKFVSINSIIHELLWFISGDTNIHYLAINGVNIWNEWPYQKYLEAHHIAEHYPKYSDRWKEGLHEFISNIKSDTGFAKQWGDLGPVYGKQWRDFGGVDQLANAIETLKSNPTDRRMVVCSWNPPEIPNMALPPCHLMYQFYVDSDKLSCQVYIRSWDVFLGGPYNIASYALLTMMIAQVCNLGLGELIIVSGDTHLYLNHLDQAKEQIKRVPYQLPTMRINPDVKNIDDFRFIDFQVQNYEHHPAIKAPISV